MTAWLKEQDRIAELERQIRGWKLAHQIAAVERDRTRQLLELTEEALRLTAEERADAKQDAEGWEREARRQRVRADVLMTALGMISHVVATVSSRKRALRVVSNLADVGLKQSERWK